MGRERKNKSNAKGKKLYCRGPVDTMAVARANYRETNTVAATAVSDTKATTPPHDIVPESVSHMRVSCSGVSERKVMIVLDDDVTSKSGIYLYLLDGNERHLNIRTFTDSMKAEAFERQDGGCPLCKKKFKIDDMDGDHIDPWREGGKTEADNCQMLCRPCNRRKGAK